MCRGIQRRKIFRDNQDRRNLVDWLDRVLMETSTSCFAWCLIPNHFHLLLKTGHRPIAGVMRRVVTGYAVTFNQRHKRMLKEQDEAFDRRHRLKARGYDFAMVVGRAAELFNMTPGEIMEPGKKPQRVRARSLVCFWAVRELGLAGTEVGKRLGLAQPAVSKAVERRAGVAAKQHFRLERRRK